MSDQKEQLNEMKSFRQMMEDIENDDVCEQCGRANCKCEPGTCECEPVNESETDRPYICVHAKHGKYECNAPTSYEAVRRAAIHWGMRNTAGVDAHLADIKHSTQFVGESDPDDTDWDAHWAREDGDDERADDLEADAEFARMDDELNENDAECDACYGLGRKPSGGADCEECGGSGTCPKLNEDFIPLGEALTQLAQAFGILIAIAAAGLYSIDSIDNPGRMRKLFRTIRQRFNLTPQDFKTSKLIDRVYRQDPDFKALVDKYMKPDGSFKSAGYSKIIDYLREKGVGDVEHFIYKLRGFRQNNPVESINLESIVEAVLNQPRDYEMSDDEMSDLGAAAQSKSSIVKDMGDELGVDVVDMPMSDFEDDFIDPEYEDSELGLRFD